MNQSHLNEAAPILEPAHDRIQALTGTGARQADDVTLDQTLGNQGSKPEGQENSEQEIAAEPFSHSRETLSSGTFWSGIGVSNRH